MKVYTQAEFDAIVRNELGIKHCPSGDYSQIGSFGEGCSFSERCSFGEWCSFGKGCSFGEWCSFGKGCSFGEWCSFGKGCSFEENRVTGDCVRMLQISRIGSRDACTYFWKCNEGIMVRCGCFFGDLEAFAAAVEQTHAYNEQYLREYRGAIEYAKLVLDNGGE